MKIAVTGASGMVGSAVTEALKQSGHEVLPLVRGASPAPGAVRWDPGSGQIDAAALEGVDAAVHLAGESINGRWTAARKKRIMDSRVEGTALLARTLASLTRKPRVLVSASAVGYYGDRGDEVLTEDSPPGTMFLSEVCRLWERAADLAAEGGIRVVSLRMGVILGRSGGAIASLLLPFKLGLGGRIGSGRQYMSWIGLTDVAGIVQHAIATEQLRGPVNATAPLPVTNREFTKTLGRVLHRPTVLPLPALAARLMLGQMADELLLASERVLPTRLQASGYSFAHAEIEDALRSALRR